MRRPRHQQQTDTEHAGRVSLAAATWAQVERPEDRPAHALGATSWPRRETDSLFSSWSSEPLRQQRIQPVDRGNRMSRVDGTPCPPTIDQASPCREGEREGRWIVTAAESLVVSVPEAAALLGVSERLVYQLLDKGLLPELPRWSRRRLIPRRAVELVVERTMADYDPDGVLQAVVA